MITLVESAKQRDALLNMMFGQHAEIYPTEDLRRIQR